MRTSRFATALIAATTVVAFTGVSGSGAAIAAPQAKVTVRPNVVGHIEAVNRVAPLPTSECVATIGIHCYSPLQYRTAYNLNPLYAHGITGAGRTIVIVDSFGSPTIQHDLQVFDAQWGLPDTTVQIVQAGTIPPFDPNDGTMVGWAQETTLDVEYAHAIAPGAHIVLVETPVAETEGVTGLPGDDERREVPDRPRHRRRHLAELRRHREHVPRLRQGDFSSLLNLRYAFKDAARHDVTVLASSGDDGATDAEADGSDPVPVPGQLVAVVGPAGHLARRHPARAR